MIKLIIITISLRNHFFDRRLQDFIIFNLNLKKIYWDYSVVLKLQGMLFLNTLRSSQDWKID